MATYRTAWYCPDCEKLTLDLPADAGEPEAWWENDAEQRSDGGTYWDGNMPSPVEEETEKE